MFDNITLTELLTAIVLAGGALGIMTKFVFVPLIQALKASMKMDDRVAALERHEKTNLQMIQDSELSSRLLCKAMIALIDNRLTGNNIDNLRLVKVDLMDFITKG